VSRNDRYTRRDPHFGTHPHASAQSPRQPERPNGPPPLRSHGSDHTRDPRSHSNRPGTRYPFEFHGKTGEYFKIWIVNIFLTIITIYIYSAWAKVRTKRYFYGNTTVDGSSFEYHATGKQLVVGRIIAAILVLVYTVGSEFSPIAAMIAFGLLVILFPWALWRSMKFNAKASSFRNVRFGFDGSAGTPYLVFLLIPLLLILLLVAAGFVLNNISGSGFTTEEILPLLEENQTLIGLIVGGITIAIFLIIPLLHKILISYSHNNHRYGTARFTANISLGKLYLISFLTLLITVAGWGCGQDRIFRTDLSSLSGYR